MGSFFDNFKEEAEDVPYIYIHCIYIYPKLWNFEETNLAENTGAGCNPKISFVMVRKFNTILNDLPRFECLLIQFS